LTLVEVVKHWGVRADEFLGPSGLSEAEVTDPARRFPYSLYVALIERARAMTGEPGIGVAWGMQMRVSAFGHLGFAAMTSATLREAIALANEFAALGITGESIRVQVEGELGSLILGMEADCGSVADVI
jgi:hypothetical protein